MAKLTIVLQGVGVAYYKEERWNALFPFDDCHTVRLKMDKNDGGISLGAIGQKIHIWAKNPPEASSYQAANEPTKFVTEFIDLTSEYGHTSGVKMKPGWKNHALLLTLENARLSENERTLSVYNIKAADGSPAKGAQTSAHPIGYSIRAEVEGEEIIIETDGPKNFSMSFKEDTEIIFDNNCQETNTRETTDLEMLYNILEDNETPFFKISVEREPKSKGSFPKVATEQSGSNLTEMLAAFLKQFQSRSNKHMEDWNPPPEGGEGLPCHFSIISRIDKSPSLPS